MAQHPASETDPSIGSSVHDFISWWADELKAMLPFSNNSTNQTFKDRLLIAMGEKEATLVLYHRGKKELLGKVDLEESPSQQQITFNSITAESVKEAHLTGVMLPISQGLKRQVGFPLAAEDELGHIISHQLERLTPFPADKIYYDYHIVKRRKDKIIVEFVAAPKKVVNRALKRVRNWGSGVDFVDLISEKSDLRHHYDLIHMLPSEREERRSGSAIFAALLVINLLLISSIIGAHWWQQSERELLLNQQIVATKIKASEANKLRQKVDFLKNEVLFLSEKKRQSPTAVKLLNEVTHLLPHGTWLERLALHKGEIHLTGLSSQASMLIGKIEASAIFEEAAFVAPLTYDQEFSAERFQISAMLSQESIK
jgi:general secretion pathway protein L